MDQNWDSKRSYYVRYLLWLLLCLPLPAVSGALLTGFATHHFSGSNWCENNYGVGYRTESNWAVGYYKNSLCKPSFYVAKEFTTSQHRPLRLGILLGAVTGYNTPVVPVVLPELVFGYHNLEVALLVNPIKLKETPQFMALQLRWRM